MVEQERVEKLCRVAQVSVEKKPGIGQILR